MAMPTDILKLSDKTEIPISRLKRKEIQDAFANYSWRSTRRAHAGRNPVKEFTDYVIIIKGKNFIACLKKGFL